MTKLILTFAISLAVAVLVVSGAPAAEEKCGPNEVFLTCGTACPEHCPTRNAKTGQLENGLNIPCIKICKVGCQCAHGYVRDLKRNNACVERAICSSP